jgi:hypothetical protein
MSVGTGGVEYENKVLGVISEQILNTDLKIKPGGTAAFSAAEPDLVLIRKSNNAIINIEIKQDRTAQMGGGSYNYDMASGKFEVSAKTEIDPELDKKIVSILDTKKKHLDALLEYSKEKNPPAIAAGIRGLPLKSTKHVWEELTRERLLVPLNGKVAVDSSFLHAHYKKKNCYYIQIGGAGLYYLYTNPLNLPVPQLRVSMQVELRLGRGGSKMDGKTREQVATGNIRAQGRLDGKMLVASPWSLDIPGHFEKLFGTVN